MDKNHQKKEKLLIKYFFKKINLIKYGFYPVVICHNTSRIFMEFKLNWIFFLAFSYIKNSLKSFKLEERNDFATNSLFFVKRASYGNYVMQNCVVLTPFNEICTVFSFKTVKNSMILLYRAIFTFKFSF